MDKRPCWRGDRCKRRETCKFQHPDSDEHSGRSNRGHGPGVTDTEPDAAQNRDASAGGTAAQGRGSRPRWQSEDNRGGAERGRRTSSRGRQFPRGRQRWRSGSRRPRSRPPQQEAAAGSPGHEDESESDETDEDFDVEAILRLPKKSASTPDDDASDDGVSESGGVEYTYDETSQDLSQASVFEFADPARDLASPFGTCPNGVGCTDLLCQFCDPYKRLVCKSGAKCWNRQCPNVHPAGWTVCEKGVSCGEYGCGDVHPVGRVPKCGRGIGCGNPDCEHLHPDEWSDDADRPGKVTFKTREEREVDRARAALPMLAYKDEFVRRLVEDGVLVVTAETGSGKTTQLSQYAAEAFDGLVVCTQPRVIAAVSIAQRVAQEFDGTSVGQSVGYRVGGRIVRGRKIMFVTDAAVVRMAQSDPWLERVGVLIVDEAHERSLNTDIVVGIAKRVRRQRPDAFRVVVSSATIDPKPFLNFFFDGLACPEPLCVPGRVYPVTVEMRHVTDDPDEIGGLLAEEVVKTLKEQPLGHCLVFLPGAREVERAIAEFKKVAPTPSWIALPLHGSLPPERQNEVMSFDDQAGGLRMVVFCTNVAETSLTVPGVRLVVDTGLAKEARYDPERRMSILELVYVSQSSADQRKGRAGRTADGHCVRLYPPDKLTRRNIQPEILRSSLDQVVLQLCGLDYDPLTFDLIDRPEEDRLRASLNLLSKLGCITSDSKVTERGRLFNRLPFDPRLCHFVLQAHTLYGQGGPATEIAAIISAPGSVVFFGAKSDKGKRPAPKDVERFSSDLVHLRSLYRRWLDAGNDLNVAGRGASATCNGCKRKLPAGLVKKEGGCRPCRVKHSIANSLNNKVLDIARNTIATVGQLVDGERAALSTVPVEEAVGRCLADAFPEQIGEFLLPANPDVGVHLVESNLKGQLSFSSTLALPRPNARFLIPMAVTKLPSGRLIVDQAHHVELDWLPEAVRDKVQRASLGMELCFERQNVGSRFRTHCFRHFQKLAEDGDHQVEFVVPLYDAARFALTVYAPQASAQSVKDVCTAQVDRLLEEELGFETVVEACNGSVKLTVRAGMVVSSVDETKQECRMFFSNPPVRSDLELLDWICKKANVRRTDVKWHKFLPACGDDAGSKGGTVVFRSEEVARRVRDQCAGDVSVEPVAEYALLVKTNVERLEDVLASHELGPVKMITLKAAASECAVKISNLPAALDQVKLRSLIDRGYLFCPKPVFVRSSPVANGAYHSTLYYRDVGACSKACGWLQCVPQLNQRFEITITRKNGGQYTKQVQTTVSELPAKPSPGEYLAVYQDGAKADKLYDLRYALPDLQVDGNVSVKVDHRDKYALGKHAGAIAGGHGVKFKFTQQKGHTCKVIFCGGRPSQCAKAAQSMRRLVAPIRHTFRDRDKQVMAEELRRSGRFEAWAKKLNLHVEHQKRFAGIAVYGELFQQGQFMAKMADYYTEFVGRYELVGLTSSAGCLFRAGCVGDVHLTKLNEQNMSKHWKMTFLYGANAIEIVVSPEAKEPAAVVKQCEAAVQVILAACHQPSVAVTKCVYCQQRPGAPFSICGHKYCKDCLEQVVRLQTSSLRIRLLDRQEAADLRAKVDGAVQCPTCSTPISIRDITSSLRRSVLEDLCTAVTLLHISITDHPLVLCPVLECKGLVPKSGEYAPCPSCNRSMCPRCGAVNDPRHDRKTCDEYSALLKQAVTIATLTGEAEKFARDHWRTFCSQRPDITRVDVNPGLKDGCLALQRYCKGIERLGVHDFRRSTVFAWHGTADQAIPAICNEGFDPGKRSGQVHGTGEYFGMSAETSMGYTKGAQQLIVAQIVKAPGVVHSASNFCYVVNNPVDWSHSFNLPVMVISFGSRAPVSWISTIKCPLPLPFYEPPPSTETKDADKPLRPPRRPRSPSPPPLGKLGLDGPGFEPAPLPSVKPPPRVDPTRKWTVPYRWHWGADGRLSEPYPEDVNVCIEKRYVAFKWASGPSSFDLKPVVRYNDSRPQVYTVDFSRMRQLNKSTGYERTVRRNRVVIPRSGTSARWTFYRLSGTWMPFEEDASVAIEVAFQKYLADGGAGCVSVWNGGCRHLVSFITGKRKNLVTELKEQVWREGPSSPPRPVQPSTSFPSSFSVGPALPRTAAYQSASSLDSSPAPNLASAYSSPPKNEKKLCVLS